MRYVIRIFNVILVFYIFAGSCHGQTVVDYDGNVYDTIVIGSQGWLKQNLKVTHYRNGIPIPNVTDINAWSGLTTGARCYYENDSATYDPVYGTLYNWYAVHDGNELCPEGWHVPSDGEWTTLENFLGGAGIAGGKMKETGTSHWLAPNAGATNSSGFTGLPGGMRGMTNTYETLHENGLWWTSTSLGAGAWSRYLWYMFAGVDRNLTPKTLGLSIRCIKDVNVGTEGEKNGPNIRIYPNPTGGILSIDCTGTPEMVAEVYGLTGTLLLRSILQQGTNSIDLSTLAKGTYIIKLTGGSELVFHKVIFK